MEAYFYNKLRAYAHAREKHIFYGMFFVVHQGLCH